MYGRETFVSRAPDDALAPRIRSGEYVWIDPDESAADGCVVGIRDPETGETAVRLLAVEGGRRVLRALEPGWPEVALTRDNETMLLGVVVFAGRGV